MKIEYVLDAAFLAQLACNGIKIRETKRGWIAVIGTHKYGPYKTQLAAFNASVLRQLVSLRELQHMVKIRVPTPTLDHRWKHMGDIGEASLYARKLGPRAVIVEAQLPGITITTNGREISTSTAETADDALIGRAVRAGLIDELIQMAQSYLD